MRIAHCDDQSIELAHFARMIAQWATLRGETADIAHFESAEAFLFSYEEDKAYDALLLDIQMGETDGMALARRIREYDADIPIIFITGYADYMAQGYDVAALQYLLKPVEAEKLFAALDRALAARVKIEPFLLFEAEGVQYRVLQRDILYLEALSHIVRIVTAKVEYAVKGQLSAMEESLDGGMFVRCHRSYIVNMRCAAGVTRTDVLLEGGWTVPLSRRLYHETQQAFIRYNREGREWG